MLSEFMRRLRASRPSKIYTVEIQIKHKGEPLKIIPFTMAAKSKGEVVKRVKTEMSISVGRIYAKK